MRKITALLVPVFLFWVSCCFALRGTTFRDVIIFTFQNNTAIQALRFSFQSERFLSDSLRANFNEIRAGFRSSQQYRVSGKDKKTIPNAEIFIEKDLQGYSFSGNLGSDFGVSDFTDNSRGYAELRAEVPILGSRKARNQQIAILKQEGDAINAQIDFFDEANDQITESLGAYNQAVANKIYFDQCIWYVGELSKLKDASLRKSDRSTVKKIEKLIYDTGISCALLRSNFESDLNLLRGSIGLSQDFAVIILPEHSGLDIDTLPNMIEFALSYSPQLLYLRAVEDSLQKQMAIVDSGKVDLLGSFNLGAELPGYSVHGKEREYFASGRFELLFIDSSVRNSQLGAIGAKLSEVKIRIAGLRNLLPIAISEKYQRVEVAKKSRNDIESGLAEAEEVYLDKLSEYLSGKAIFDEVHLALLDFYGNRNRQEANSLEHANRLAELLESSGCYFKVLEEANIPIDIM